MKTSYTDFSLVGRAMLVAAILGLTACGGGGGSGTTALGEGDPRPVEEGEGVDNSDHPDFLVDASEARTLIGGSSLGLTASEIADRLQAIATDSDAFLAIDPYLFLEGGSERITASCTGSSCDFTSGTEIDTVDISTEDFEGDEYQAVMTHRGVSIAQLAESDPGEVYTEYGGWLDHSVFGVTVEERYDVNDGSETDKQLRALSYGDSSGTNPTGSGTATWAGAMIGVDVSATTLSGDSSLLQGDAGVTVDFDNVDVDVAFTNVYDLDTRQSRSDMSWADIPMTDGAFETGSGTNRLEGRFYGPNHEEVGGVFERDQIVGSFGASSSGTPTPGGDDSGLPAYPVDANEARTLIGGSSLGLTSGEIAGELQAIATSSDTLLAIDSYLFSQVSVDRALASCTGSSCGFFVLHEGSSQPTLFETIDISTESFDADQSQAVMIHRGVSIAQGARFVPGELVEAMVDQEYTEYGGWLDHSGFAVTEWFGYAIDDSDSPTYRWLNAVSFGDSSGTSPVGGTATWTGVMVGVDVRAATLSNDPSLLQGDAGVTVDFNDADVDVAFTNIFDLDTRQSRSDMSWANIPMTSGAFETGSGTDRIEGSFYGSAHEEVGGVFERGQIYGAFGAQRD